MIAFSKKKERGLGIVLQYAQMALNILIQLIYTPFLLHILSQNEFGIYNLAASTIAYLALLSLGFGASYLRYYSKFKSVGNEEGIKELNGLYLIVFTLMGSVALIIGFILTLNVELFFNDSYSSHDIEIARVLMAFLTVNMAISFPVSVFDSYITSQERFVFQKSINMIRTICNPIVCGVLLYLGYGSIGMVVASTFLTIVIGVINIIFCLQELNMKISFRIHNWKLLADIFSFSIFIAINQLIDQLNWQADKVILGKIVNGTAVAVYAVGASINTMYTSFSSAISSVFAPKINMIVSEGNSNMDDELSYIFNKVGRIQWFILALILSGFIFWGQFFIEIWAGEGYEKAYWVAIMLMAPATVPLIQNIGLEIQRAKNKHQIRSIAYLLMAIVNVMISIFFASLWGEIGAALGTTISIIIVPIIFMNCFYQLKLGINVVKFWKSIMGTLPSFIIPVVVGIVIHMYHRIDSISDFVFCIGIYSITYMLSVYWLGLNNDEKGMIRGAFKMLIRDNEAN